MGKTVLQNDEQKFEEVPAHLTSNMHHRMLCFWKKITLLFNHWWVVIWCFILRSHNLSTTNVIKLWPMDVSSGLWAHTHLKCLNRHVVFLTWACIASIGISERNETFKILRSTELKSTISIPPNVPYIWLVPYSFLLPIISKRCKYELAAWKTIRN